MAVSHVKSVTIADGTNTDLVRPGDWNSVHNQYYTLAGNTNNASTVSGTNVVLSGGNNVTLIGSGASIGVSVGNYLTTAAQSDHTHSQYLTTAAQSDHSHGVTLNLTNLSGTTGGNSNGINLSLSAAAAAGGATLAGFLEAGLDREWLAAQIGQAQLFLQPFNVRQAVQFEELVFPINYSNASNSSNSVSLSISAGIYTRDGNSLSRIASASASGNVTNSGTAGSYSIYGGLRDFPVPLTTTLSAGNYWLGFLSRTTTGGGAGMTISNFVASNINSIYSGRWGSANNATNQYVLGMGSYATTTTALPNTIAFSQINGSAAVNLRPVIFEAVSADLN
jgi:hypothetical protein